MDTTSNTPVPHLPKQAYCGPTRVRRCRVSFKPHNNPADVPVVVPVSHLRNLNLREVQSVAQGKARTSGLLQSHSDSRAGALTCVVILPKLRVIPLAQASAPKARHGRVWRGPPSDGDLAKADPLPFSISHLAPPWDWECELWFWAEGRSAHLQSPAVEGAGTRAPRSRSTSR